MIDDAGTDEVGGAQALESLLGALATWPDFESSTRLSMEQWSNLTAGEVKARQDASIDAVRRVANLREVEEQIRALGRLRYEPAVPTLIGLWRQCPVHPVEVASAHALFEIGNAEARDVLRQGIHDREHLGRFMALKVMFSDEAAAWDNVGHLFADESLATPGGAMAAAHALSFLSPRMFDASGPVWQRYEMRDLMSQDRRWLDLCIRLRDHQVLGRSARNALKYADPDVTGPALDAARAARAVRHQPDVRALRPGELVERYENGDHRGVWRELEAVGHLDGVWRAEADQVATLTMERVRRNVRNLAEALIARGWPIDPGKALPGPSPEIEDRLKKIEQITGCAVAPALAAYWRIIGTIDLVPRDSWNEPFPPGVPEQLALADPLEIVDLDAVWFTVEEWQEESGGLHPEIAGPVEVIIAADYLHKADYSGGGPYSVWLPYAGADPLIRDEEHGLTFTDYLRAAFAGKGFLRLDHQDEWLTHGITREELAELTDWLASVEYEHIEF